MGWIVVHILGESNFPVRRDDRYRHPIALGAPVMPGAQARRIEGNVPKSTRLLAVAAAALIALTACTSNSADPGTSSTATSSTSGAASTSAPATSVPVTFTVAARRVKAHSQRCSTRRRPTPGRMGSRRSRWQMLRLRSIHTEIIGGSRRCGCGSRSRLDRRSIRIRNEPREDRPGRNPRKVGRPWSTFGRDDTLVAPIVLTVENGVVAISDCVDKTSTDSLDSSGNSVKAPNGPGSYFRHPSTIQVVQRRGSHLGCSVRIR